MAHEPALTHAAATLVTLSVVSRLTPTVAHARAWGTVRETLKQHFHLAESEIVYCGMALGYADPDAAVNRLRSTRADVDEFTTFAGFPESFS